MAIITPLITRLKDKGTFITFQSTAEDVSYTFNNSSKKMRFSKFVLLDLPNIESPASGENYFNFKNIESVFINGLSNASPQVTADSYDLANSLQNYMLNLETVLITDADYDANTNLNVAERVFFKWLKEVGAIRFEAADANEKSSSSSNKFVEEVSDDYSSVVKYIGEIDIEGSHRDSTNAYKEIYALIPTNHGKTPVVLFKSEFDDNYKIGIYKSDSEYIVGRDGDDDPTSAGLSVIAQFDVDVPKSSFDYTVDGDAEHPYDSLLTDLDTDLYVLGPANDPSNLEIERDDDGTIHSFIKSNLDGIMIDFDQSSYKYFEDNPTKTSFAQYNDSGSGGDFEFNTMLIYYDVWDEDNPDDVSTNLYGIAFLDDLEAVSVSGSKITSLTKYQPNESIRKQGNSYGLRLNLKFDITADNVDQRIEVSVNDYNTFSMLLFSEAMEQMYAFNYSLQNAISTHATMSTRMDALEQLVLNQATREQYESRLSNIEAQLADVEPNSELLTLIRSMDDRINNILAGNEVDIPVTYRFNLIPRGNMVISRDDNYIYMESSNDPYTSISKKQLFFDVDQSLYKKNIITNVNNGLVYHEDTLATATMGSDLYLYINDSIIKWKANKFIEIKIDQQIDFAGYGIIIKTDALNAENNSSEYGVLIKGIPGSELMSHRPHIRIICISTAPLKFITMLL